MINNSDHPVNNKTAARVQEAVRQLNYEPNRMAQGLKNNKSRIIGVIVHDISDSYFSEMVKGIEAVTFNYDYIVNIYNTSRNAAKEIKALKMLKANRAEAVIMTGGTLLDDDYNAEMKRLIPQLKGQGCRILGVTTRPFDIMNIELGNYTAGYMITQHLINRGHHRIAFVAGPDILKTSKERLQGYKDALDNSGIAENKSRIIPGDFTFEGGRKAAEKIMDYSKTITAAAASNDESGLGLMWQLRENGFTVPDDISVTGIGNIPSSRYAVPPLTTVNLPIYRLGKKIGEYIIRELKNGKSRPITSIKLNIKERSSVKKIKPK